MIDYMSQITASEGSKIVKVAETTDLGKYFHRESELSGMNAAIVVVTPDADPLPEFVPDCSALDAINWHAANGLGGTDSTIPGIVKLPEALNNLEKFKEASLLFEHDDLSVFSLQDRKEDEILDSVVVIVLNGANLTGGDSIHRYSRNEYMPIVVDPEIIFNFVAILAMITEELFTINDVPELLLPPAHNLLEQALRKEAIDVLNKNWGEFHGFDSPTGGGAA